MNDNKSSEYFMSDLIQSMNEALSKMHLPGAESDSQLVEAYGNIDGVSVASISKDNIEKPIQCSSQVCNGLDKDKHSIGFDHVKMVVAMKRRAPHKSSEQMREDMLKLALLFQRRGASVEKILRTSHEEVVTFIKQFESTYTLQYKRGGTPFRINSASVTINRVAIVMAAQLVKFIVDYNARKGEPPQTPADAVHPEISKRIPLGFHTSVLANLIPKDKAFDKVFNAYVSYMQIWDRIINKNKRADQTTPQVLKYQVIARNSKMYKEPQRINAMVFAGVLDEKHDFVRDDKWWVSLKLFLDGMIPA